MKLPKITILYDIKDWAFHNVAQNVSAVTSGFEYSLYGKADWNGQPLASEIVKDADVIVFLWRFDLLTFLDSLDEASWERMLSPNRPALVAMVYDHLHQDLEMITKLGDPYPVCDLVCASSERLGRTYNETPHLPDIFCTLSDGVNLDRFFPLEERSSSEKPLSIGWVGNSAWGKHFGTDLKGRRGIFDVALSMLEARGLPFDTQVADSAETRIPVDEMPGFYRNLDVLACTSAIEGTPNPVLEAMASGVAVVSTDVGIVAQSLGEEQSRFILADRNAEAFAEAFTQLITDRELHKSLCQENISRRDLISWKSRGPLWNKMFKEAMTRRKERGDGSSSEALARYKATPWRRVGKKH
jgi:glycosyltransferase involved in cell wall biosynthesis